MAKLVYMGLSLLLLTLMQLNVASQQTEECSSIGVLWYGPNYKQSPSFYDNHPKKCVIKIGSMCNEKADNCPSNANCKMMGGNYEFGYCRCKPNLITDSDKKFCGLPSGFNEICSADVNNPRVCDFKSTGTTCINGTCQCESGIYDMDRHKCKSLFGGFCDYGRDQEDGLGCVENAHCTYGDSCQCSKGYFPTKNKFCLGIRGGRCSAESPCYDGFICTDGICVCPHPLGQIFHSETNSCINLVGAACDNVESKCVENAVCDDGTCRCREGFYKTVERKCEPLKVGFNESCSATTCNERKGLACVGGSCLCVDQRNLVYIEGHGCATKGGGRCGWLPANGKENCDDTRTDCEKYFVSCQFRQSCIRNPEGFWNCAAYN